MRLEFDNPRSVFQDWLANFLSVDKIAGRGAKLARGQSEDLTGVCGAETTWKTGPRSHERRSRCSRIAAESGIRVKFWKAIHSVVHPGPAVTEKPYAGGVFSRFY